MTTPDENALANCVRQLCEVLHQTYEGETGRSKSAILLVDEFDKPLNALVDNEEEYLKLRKFLQRFFGQSFKANDTLVRGLVTGSMPIAHNAIVLTNDFAQPHTIFHNRYAKLVVLRL